MSLEGEFYCFPSQRIAQYQYQTYAYSITLNIQSPPTFSLLILLLVEHIATLILNNFQ